MEYVEKTDFDKIVERVTSLENAIPSMNNKVSEMETLVKEMDIKVNDMEIKVKELEKKVKELEERVTDIEEHRLGIKVVTHSFHGSRIGPAFSKKNKLTMGVKSVEGYVPKFAILRDSGRSGYAVETCCLVGDQIRLRLFANFRGKDITPKVDVVYFKERFN